MLAWNYADKADPFLDIRTVDLFSYIGLEALVTVTMNKTVVWDVMPCSKIEVRRRFGGAYYL
jgi:hypothetical protein